MVTVVFISDAEKCHLTVPDDVEHVHILHIQEPPPSLPDCFVQVLIVVVVLQTQSSLSSEPVYLVCLSVCRKHLTSCTTSLPHCNVCLDIYIVLRVCRIEELRMTLLGLPDSAHEFSTNLRNFDTIYKSTLYRLEF